MLEAAGEGATGAQVESYSLLSRAAPARPRPACPAATALTRVPAQVEGAHPVVAARGGQLLNVGHGADQRGRAAAAVLAVLERVVPLIRMGVGGPRPQWEGGAGEGGRRRSRTLQSRGDLCGACTLWPRPRGVWLLAPVRGGCLVAALLRLVAPLPLISTCIVTPSPPVPCTAVPCRAVPYQLHFLAAVMALQAWLMAPPASLLTVGCRQVWARDDSTDVRTRSLHQGGAKRGSTGGAWVGAQGHAGPAHRRGWWLQAPASLRP